ncbi:SH2 domain protein [Oesophagostomum dentatum]|uniref:SH2 domain protein n=1 Tax=Oesophagostomum dentatum TaxID=61180 RepID=A0A0B1S6D0_OESDE|nr:SH2 domain protein [Oesophagostomum dentatum]
MQGRNDDVPPLDNFDPTLRKCDYFHGLLPREDTVSLLNKNGDFLTRISEGDSQGTKLETVISVLHDPKSRCRGTAIKEKEDFIMHIIVVYAKRKYSVTSDRGFNTVPELISYYSKSPMFIRSVGFNPICTRLVPGKAQVNGSSEYRAHSELSNVFAAAAEHRWLQKPITTEKPVGATARPVE